MSIRSLGMIVGYLFTLFITRVYGAPVFGLVSLAFSLFVIVGMLGRFGLDINLVKYYSDVRQQSNIGLFYRILLKSLVISIFLGIVLYLSGGAIANGIFSKPKLQPYISWIACTIPFWSVSLICAGYLRARGQNHWFAILNNPGRFFFSLLFIVLLAKFIDDPLNAIKAHFYGVVVLAIVAFVASARAHGPLSFSTDVNSWTFVKEAIPMMLSSTVLVLLGWLDTFVLGIYETETNIGIYNVALKIATFTTFTLQAINSILAPKVARSYSEGDMATFQKTIRFSTRINFFSTLFIVVFIVVSHKWILALFGEEFKSGTTILFVLCAGQVLNSVSGSVGLILQMAGKQLIYQNIVLVALFLNLLLNFSLTPLYGTLGAATATVVSMVTWNVLGAWYIKRKMNTVSYYDFR